MMTLFGWIIIGIAIASLICLKRKDGYLPPHQQSGTKDQMEEISARPPGDALCETIEILGNSSVLLFDPSLKLAAAGKNGRKLIGSKGGTDDTGLHMMDVIPTDSSALFIGAAGAARRGSRSSFKCRWKDRMITVITAPARPHGIIVSIQEAADE